MERSGIIRPHFPSHPQVNPESFQQLVDRHYAALYRFGLSLAGRTEAAADLVQQTYCLWAEKGHQLRDATKAKSWLFTTLYREYLGTYRRSVRFPHVELDDAAGEMPVVEPAIFNELDGGTVVEALALLPEVFRAPVTLFYLQELSYKEIADVLDVPIGTVMSRLSRGKAELRRLLTETRGHPARKVIPFTDKKGAA